MTVLSSHHRVSPSTLSLPNPTSTTTTTTTTTTTLSPLPTTPTTPCPSPLSHSTSTTAHKHTPSLYSDVAPPMTTSPIPPPPSSSSPSTSGESMYSTTLVNDHPLPMTSPSPSPSPSISPVPINGSTSMVTGALGYMSPNNTLLPTTSTTTTSGRSPHHPSPLPPSSTTVHMANTAMSRTGSAPKGLFKAITLIEYHDLRFIIMDAPSETNLVHYVKELLKYGVTDICRACEPTYTADALIPYHIQLHELNFKDGDPPPPHIVSQWLQLVSNTFSVPASNNKQQCPPPVDGKAIAVHCVAGLGRAPVLVAVALIEAGMNPLEAVEFIRSKRRGALNMKQIHFLDAYKRKNKGKGIHTGPIGDNSKCCVM